MTRQSIIYGPNRYGTNASLVWDDEALTAREVSIHIDASQPAALVATAVLDGSPITETYSPGTDTTWPFDPPRSVTVTQLRGGGSGIAVSGFSNFGVASA